ncbi:MAG: hypothetical protein J1E35_10455 [Lachnospiraceae bacterium]|nr:hypothetical protein [Lachnospiraceae bacterium]
MMKKTVCAIAAALLLTTGGTQAAREAVLPANESRSNCQTEEQCKEQLECLTTECGWLSGLLSKTGCDDAQKGNIKEQSEMGVTEREEQPEAAVTEKAEQPKAVATSKPEAAATKKAEQPKAAATPKPEATVTKKAEQPRATATPKPEASVTKKAEQPKVTVTPTPKQPEVSTVKIPGWLGVIVKRNPGCMEILEEIVMKKSECPNAAATPKPEQPKVTATPKPEQSKVTATPKPEQPKVTATPKPEQPKATATPKPEQPKATVTPTPKAEKEPEVQDKAYTYGLRITELVNQYRAEAGLSPVKYSAELSKAAQTRAFEIEKSFSHTRPDGRYFSTVLKDYGISYNYAGENIAWGQKSPEEVVTAWMNSPGHRANILNKSFTKLGVGYQQNSKGVNYFTQLFTN